jgi:hypothetical protein
MYKNIAFFTVDETLNENSYVGAILITNNEGLPLEFQCTYPIRPTAIQKILYGAPVKNYIGINLCGETLLEKIDNKPTLIILNQYYLLGLREKVQCPVIFLRSDSQAGNGETIIELPESEITTGKEITNKKYLISTMPKFNEEILQSLDDIKNIFSFINPMEPFERIRQALTEIKEKDEKFRCP